MGAPPYRHTEYMPMARPNLALSSWICVASSRVGARTVTVGPTGRGRTEACLPRMCMIPGKRYPNVCRSVFATEMRSYPCCAMGHDCAWIGVGDLYPALSTASMSSRGHSQSVKRCMASGTTMPCGALTVISLRRRYSAPSSVVW